jgi:hypothetical protein
MSATIERPPATVTQRGSDATAHLREIFGFDSLKLMSIAVAEAAVIEARKNPAFVEHVRKAYQELESTPKTSARKPRSAHKTSTLMPIARVEGYDFDPLAPVDPYFLYKSYGATQFTQALEEETLSGLKAAAHKLMEAHPGTKPKSLSKKADVIAYIVEIVTGK